MSNVDLSSPGNQTTFAKLVGVQQPTIAKQKANGVLSEGGTMGQWLLEYTEHLREQAAGRGGDAQTSLTLARIDESRENTAEKKQRRLMGAGALVSKHDAMTLIQEGAGNVQTLVLDAGETILERLQEKHDIEIDDADIFEPLRSTLGQLGRSVQELARNIGSLGGGSGSK